MPVKKLITLTEENFQKLQEIQRLRGITTTSGCVTALINDAYNSDHDKTADDTQLREIAASVDKLLMIARESESMIYQERDGINTLLHFYEVQEYQSADKRQTASPTMCLISLLKIISNLCTGDHSTKVFRHCRIKAMRRMTLNDPKYIS